MEHEPGGEPITEHGARAEEGVHGVYLYCLARPEGGAAMQALARQDLTGVDDRFPIGTLEQDGVLAVIGAVEPGEFHEHNLLTLSWVAPRACRHERVVEAVMAASPVLPVKFGTIFRSAARLRELLAGHRRTIEAFLDDLGDKAEWGVKGYLDDATARRAVAEEDPAIRSRQASLPSSPGARYLQQKKLDAMIDAALRQWLEGVAHGLHEHLAPYAVNRVELPPLSSAVTGRPERMMFNGSYLVAPAALPRFRSAVSEYAGRYQVSGLTWEVRGPWPPYNFCPALTEGDPEVR